MTRIGVIDLEISNLGSVINMIKKCGGEATPIRSATEASECSSLILPGVGSFDNGIKRIDNMGIRNLLKDFSASGKPLLGICLGMQMLFDSSDEGNSEGLGIIPGSVKKLSFSGSNLKVPHMGWNEIQIRKQIESFSHLQSGDRFYFVHSYFAAPKSMDNILFETKYGQLFTSGVIQRKTLGVQFHPEKSHRFGITFFKSYLEWIK